jgi:lipopolysaccharide transport system ATP-binding protein
MAITVSGVSKSFLTFSRPEDRLKQAVMPRVARWLGREPRRYFREFCALTDVSFTVSRGETVGIIGRNGAGKSTLLQIICGTLSPSSGSVASQGRIAALLELGAGFNPEFSGRENVYLNATLLGLSKDEISKRMPQIEAFAEIGDFINQPVKTYSSGMAVRLAFSVIAHVDADILIIDEALAVGDALFVQKCMRFLRAFAGRGTLLFVSHDTAAVLSLCDRAVWLDRGTVAMDGVPKTVSEAYMARIQLDAQGDDPSRARIADTPVAEDPPPAASASAEAATLAAQGSSFGAGGARVETVELMTKAGRAISTIEGGENVRLRLCAAVLSAMDSPILGFYVRDRLGQNLFGENTFVEDQAQRVSGQPGALLTADFEFTMPLLQRGDYSICVAVADGTPLVHVQHHWINDALIFRSIRADVNRGLVGLADMRAQLKTTTRIPT